MYCMNLLFLELKNYSEGEIKFTELLQIIRRSHVKVFYILSKKSCWIIIPKKVIFRYRSETLLKQISLQLFLNYSTNILEVSFVYFAGHFSRSRRSHLTVFSKENTCASVLEDVFKRNSGTGVSL